MACGCPPVSFSRDEIIADPNENQAGFFAFSEPESTDEYEEIWWNIKINLLGHPNYQQRINYGNADVPIRFAELGFVSFGLAVGGGQKYWLPEIPIQHSFSLISVPPDVTCFSYWLYPAVYCRFVFNFGKCDLL